MTMSAEPDDPLAVLAAQAALQPSPYATSTRPSRSTVMSLKSSRLRWLQMSARSDGGIVVPCRSMQPRCTTSFGVVSTVVHVFPPSYVVEMYRCHGGSLGNALAWSSPM